MPDRHDLHTAPCDILGCRYPILQAGMGGVARAELVAAVARAGAYGCLGMVREPAEVIGREIDAVRERTDRPFGVNLIPAATEPALLEEELSVCFEKAVHSLCLFWDVQAEVIRRAKAAGCLVLHQVGSVEDARAAERAGADILIAQGFEAGGHVRGVVSSLVLVPQVVRAASVPVIASGGFASGESLVAALALGASGVHCGTAFLATEESFAHAYHKERVVSARSEETVYTDVFAINWPPNAPVRVIANSVTEEFRDRPLGHRPTDFPHEVIAEDDGRAICKYSTDSPLRTTRGDIESLALFAGQVCGAIERESSAGERIEEMVRAARETLDRLQGLSNETGS